MVRIECLSFTDKIKNVRHIQLVRNTLGEKPLGIVVLSVGKAYVKCENVDWINYAHDRIQWWE